MTSFNLPGPAAREHARFRLSLIAVAIVWIACSASSLAGDDTCKGIEEPDDDPLAMKLCLDSGRLMDLKVGDNKQQAVAALTQLRATSLNVIRSPFISVSRPEELHLLARASGITLVPGNIIIRFSGDRIEHVSGGPEQVWGRWVESLRLAKTRSEAFTVLAELLKSREGSVELIESDSSGRVLLGSVSAEEWNLLESMDDWRTNFRHPTGFWYLYLLFDDSGRLIRILAIASARELL